MKRQFFAWLLAAALFWLPGSALAASPAVQAAGTWTVAPKTETVNHRLPAAVFKAKPEIIIRPDGRGSLSFMVKKKGRKKRKTYKGQLAFKKKEHLTVTSKALKRWHLKSVTGRCHLSSNHNRLTLSSAGEEIVLTRKSQNDSNYSERNQQETK